MVVRSLAGAFILGIYCLTLPVLAQDKTKPKDVAQDKTDQKDVIRIDVEQQNPSKLDAIDLYWGELLDPNRKIIGRNIQLVDNVECIARWHNAEYFITTKIRELKQNTPLSELKTQEVNDILKEYFEKEIPDDIIQMVVVFRWTPGGPEYTLPSNMGSKVILSNEKGILVEGKLQEELWRDLTLRQNSYYRSMILAFDRYVPVGKNKKNPENKVDILADTKTLNLKLTYIKKAGKPVEFTFDVRPKYDQRPREMALLVDFFHETFKPVR
ncbi:MAG TPA: hypothetical protein PK395_11615 [bacterium]|nr:hypothetical protein [bacterium]HQP99941.1 hypothetical protein [bacterium]